MSAIHKKFHVHMLPQAQETNLIYKFIILQNHAASKSEGVEGVSRTQEVFAKRQLKEKF